MAAPSLTRHNRIELSPIVQDSLLQSPAGARAVYSPCVASRSLKPAMRRRLVGSYPRNYLMQHRPV